MHSHTYYNDMLGRIRITEDKHAIVAIEFADGEMGVNCSGDVDEEAQALLDKAYLQIEEYLEGRRHEFNLPVFMKGTPFEQEVWSALLDIPYGETRTYGEVAAMVGRPGAARAIGMANNHNRLPLIVPCHRVLGADGRLTGYSGGIERKRKLLTLEREGLKPA